MLCIYGLPSNESLTPSLSHLTSHSLPRPAVEQFTQRIYGLPSSGFFSLPHSLIVLLTLSLTYQARSGAVHAAHLWLAIQ
jgi:hypothetical protein